MNKKNILLIIIGTVFIFYLLINREIEYNKKIHTNDTLVTEWISPDGVHYWYQLEGYHAMLAPRYNNNGELVIDK